MKRTLLFLGGCMVVRFSLAMIAYKYPVLSKQAAPLALLPVIGWLYIYFIGKRDTGPEVFGGKIWWNALRPVHAFMYLLFYIYRGKSYSWAPLGADTLLGLVAWLYNKNLM